MRLLEEVTNTFVYKMSKIEQRLDWSKDVYGKGIYAKGGIEVNITKDVIGRLGGQSGIGQHNYPSSMFEDANAFEGALNIIKTIQCLKRYPYIDGYIPKSKCFIEAKVRRRGQIACPHLAKGHVLIAPQGGPSAHRPIWHEG